MNLAFFTVFRRDPQHFLHATGLVSSIQTHQPSASIVQLTDDVTPAVSGVHDVRRLPSGAMYDLRLTHYIDCARAGDWLFVDTDVTLREDVSDVFDQPFDIAVTDRRWAGLPQGDTVMHDQPFNMGIVFTRGGAGSDFWRDVQTAWNAFPPARKGWLDIQIAFYDVIRTGKYRVRVLPGEVYNYPPRSAEDACTGAKIVHYKGADRHAWYTQQIERSWAAEAVTAAASV